LGLGVHYFQTHPYIACVLFSMEIGGKPWLLVPNSVVLYEYSEKTADVGLIQIANHEGCAADV